MQHVLRRDDPNSAYEDLALEAELPAATMAVMRKWNQSQVAPPTRLISRIPHPTSYILHPTLAWEAGGSYSSCVLHPACCVLHAASCGPQPVSRSPHSTCSTLA